MYICTSVVRITDYVENVLDIRKPYAELCIFCATGLSDRICDVFYGTLLRRDYEYVHLESWLTSMINNI